MNRLGFEAGKTVLVMTILPDLIYSSIGNLQLLEMVLTVNI